MRDKTQNLKSVSFTLNAHLKYPQNTNFDFPFSSNWDINDPYTITAYNVILQKNINKGDIIKAKKYQQCGGVEY